jgi:hypothetical protein
VDKCCKYLGQKDDRGSITGKGIIIKTNSGVYTALGAVSPEVNRWGHETDHAIPSVPRLGLAGRASARRTRSRHGG